MFTRILNAWTNFRSSFWFVPTMLMLFATVAAFGMIQFDKAFSGWVLAAFPMFEMSPSAARSILSSIVGAMVSTTGVVFSITIVALSLASSQFGSRLIRTYRNRSTSHFTLGIFVSTSLFCILVLASIREVNDFAFVPTASVLVGILLTVICLATLVYYIHDMSQAIQAPNVIQHSATDLDDAIQRLFPEKFGEDEGNAARDESGRAAASAELGDPDFDVCCLNVGYIQAIENETIMGIANEKDVVIRLLIRPGDFLYQDRKIAEVFCERDLSQDDGPAVRSCVEETLQRSLIVGPNRTHMQDVRHAFDELVDIAVRALSPGINDPFTAINCVDRIHTALVALQHRDSPSSFRVNGDGQLRVIAAPVTFKECVHGSLGVIENYAQGNPIVQKRIAEALGLLQPEGP